MDDLKERGASLFRSRVEPTDPSQFGPDDLSNHAERTSGGVWRADGDFAYLKRIARIVQDAILEGGRRLMLNMPPVHGKSELIFHRTPCWILDTWPDWEIIGTSYSDDLAHHYGRKVRDELRDNPDIDVQLNPDAAGVSEFRTVEGGGMLSTGMKGGITGFHGDVIIVDDPIKNEQDAMSRVKRERRRRWWNGTLWDRRKKGATVILLMQRWDVNDLAGWLLEEEGEKWEVLNFPAIQTEENARQNVHDPRDPGEALNPTLMPLEELVETRQDIPRRVWLSKYQQDPPKDAGENAITTQEQIDELRVKTSETPAYRGVVVGVDPPGSEEGAEAGIVADAFGFDGEFYTPEDYSLKGKPSVWGSAAVELYHDLEADWIVGETNFGGDMVASTILSIDPNVAFDDVNAKRGKLLRAGDVDVLYNRHERLHHVGVLEELEEQLIKWTQGSDWSPDRLDAHVYAVKKLIEMFGSGEGSHVSDLRFGD